MAQTDQVPVGRFVNFLLALFAMTAVFATTDDQASVEDPMTSKWTQYSVDYKDVFIPRNVTRQVKLWVDSVNNNYRLQTTENSDVFTLTVLYSSSSPDYTYSLMTVPDKGTYCAKRKEALPQLIDLMAVHATFFPLFEKVETRIPILEEYKYGDNIIIMSSDKSLMKIKYKSFLVDLTNIRLGESSVTAQDFLLDFDLSKCVETSDAVEPEPGTEQQSDQELLEKLKTTEESQSDDQYATGIVVANLLLRKSKMELQLTDLLKQQVILDIQTDDIKQKHKEIAERIIKEREEEIRQEREEKRKLLQSLLDLEKKQEEINRKELEKMKLEQKLQDELNKQDEL